MVKFLISVLIVSLSVVSLFSLKGCDRQDPLPKVVKELPQLPETAAGGMARSAIEKAKGVRQRWERQAIGQPRPVRKGRHKPEV